MPELPFLSYEDLVLQAKKEVEKLGPEYVYENEMSPGGCYYFAADEEWDAANEQILATRNIRPSCIVGHMIWDLDLYKPTDSLPGWNEDSGVCEIVVTTGPVHDEIFRTDEKGLFFLDRLQTLQDKAVPWGKALEEAQKVTQTTYP